MSTCLVLTTLTEKGVQTLGSARLESLPLLPVDELLESFK